MVFWGCALALAAAATAPGATAPVPVILDTDIGGDIDDTWALCFLLACPEVDLKLVVTDQDNTPEKARLVGKILERAGRTDIPIGIGVKTSDAALNQARWIEGYDLAKYPGTVHQDGVNALIRGILDSPRPITLVTIGPVPNIREALRREPGIAAKARVVAMAGSVHVGYNGKPTPDPECNVVSDIPAWRALLAAPWDVTISPLDGCGTMVLRGERFAAMEASQSPLARIVIENYDLWAHRDNHPRDASSVLFDTVAAYLAFADSFCDMETVKLSVDDKGVTVPDAQGKPVHCQLRWKDRDAFEDLLVARLTGASAQH